MTASFNGRLAHSELSCAGRIDDSSFPNEARLDGSLHRRPPPANESTLCFRYEHTDQDVAQDRVAANGLFDLERVATVSAVLTVGFSHGAVLAFPMALNL